MSAGFATERELKLTKADFDRVRKLIHKHAGIFLADNKVEMVYGRLVRRLRLMGQQDFSSYLDILERDSAHPEWEHFTNALTTNLTAFFREKYHFPLLADHIRSRKRVPRIWTCAASTGEEAYSIAITVAETLGSLAYPECVLGTDVDTSALTRAKAGIYTMERVKGIAPARLKRFFQKGSGSRTGQVRVRPELRSMVEFKPVNLLNAKWDVSGPIDVIFCRNLMIYFDQTTQKRILDQFKRLLRPDGLLFAGHSENFTYITSDYRLRGSTVYELSR